MMLNKKPYNKQQLGLEQVIDAQAKGKKMLIPNVSELDELPFLKLQRHKWENEQEEGEKSRIRLLEHLRCMSYQCSSVMAKLFMFQKSAKKDTSNMKQNKHAQSEQEQLYEELIVTTQKQIISLEKFYYLLNEILPQQEFSRTVNSINVFTQNCKNFIRDQSTSRFEVDFITKEFLTFNLYMERSVCGDKGINKNLKEESKIENFNANDEKQYRFFIKCSISTFFFVPFKDIRTPKLELPQEFEIIHPLVVKKLIDLYKQLQSIPLSITQKSITRYISYYDHIQYLIDEEYLKLQVFKSYPLLRSKYYLPVVFRDRITNEKLDGPIFSNANPQCMFGHFFGYNADTIKILQGNNCQECHCLFEGVQQNPIMTHLRDNLFNPYKADVLYCPEYNRFKLYKKLPIKKSQIQEQLHQQQQQPQFKSHITYLNYLHFRCNMKKTTTKRRNMFNQMLEYEKFPLTFDLWGRRLMIMDPARGKNCAHYQFTDLRLLYLNKENSQSNRYKCPICGDSIVDSDILYMREVQILVKYLKFKCAKYKQFALTGFCFIDHRLSKVFIEFKKPNAQTHTAETQIIEIKNFYQTLIDPYMSFNEFSLGIVDKYQQKMRNRYIFGSDEQNQDKNSDDQFEFGKGGFQDFQGQKLSKKIQKISVEKQGK